MGKTKQENHQWMLNSGIVAVIRLDNTENMVPFVRSLRRGGVSCIEITMTTPGAVEWIRTLSEEVDDVLVGAGTVLDPESAQSALQAGAEFIVSPRLDEGLIRIGRSHGAVVVPSGLTPTELVSAVELGGDMVKLFPAGPMGPEYLRKIMGPYPQLSVMVTGGINTENARDYLESGADVVGVGSALVNEQAIRNEQWDRIEKSARTLVETVEGV